MRLFICGAVCAHHAEAHNFFFHHFPLKLSTSIFNSWKQWEKCKIMNDHFWSLISFCFDEVFEFAAALIELNGLLIWLGKRGMRFTIVMIQNSSCSCILSVFDHKPWRLLSCLNALSLGSARLSALSGDLSVLCSSSGQLFLFGPEIGCTRIFIIHARGCRTATSSLIACASLAWLSTSTVLVRKPKGLHQLQEQSTIKASLSHLGEKRCPIYKNYTVAFIPADIPCGKSSSADPRILNELESSVLNLDFGYTGHTQTSALGFM